MSWDFNDLIGLDFETYSDVNLKTHGQDRYINSEFFQPLLAGAARFEADGAIRRQSFAGQEKGTINLAGLTKALRERFIVAHNAPFEAAVLRRMGIEVSTEQFIDSSVIARAVGATGALAQAAEQLLQAGKDLEGPRLIKLFCSPGKYQKENGNGAFDPRIISDNRTDWNSFNDYCMLDAQLGLEVCFAYHSFLTDAEQSFAVVTARMNEFGWNVDVSLVQEMQARYLRNLVDLESDFRSMVPAAGDLNFRSYPQMVKFCAERKVKASSFDEDHVKMMIDRLASRLKSEPPGPRRTGYQEVLQLMQVKKELGGSSLKKLQVILDTVGEDGRLRNQYFHCGAPQSLRTTGRSVQMQNLKRLKTPMDMNLLMDDPFHSVSNDEMASNLRQVFCSRYLGGALLVGDFKSVESRGLAYWAGEHWKMDAYRAGKDLYEVLAAKIYRLGSSANVDKFQRSVGKVGELGCGYQAGGPAVQRFSAKMGVPMTEGEAARLVYDWRDSCPKTVAFWAELDQMLHAVVEKQSVSMSYFAPFDGLELMFRRIALPKSLDAQLGPSNKAVSFVMEVRQRNDVLMKRYFHGCYIHGRNVNYFKASKLKSGQLWSDRRKDPVTKDMVFYSLYGGKLAGILTQSFCREIFFRVAKQVDAWAQQAVSVDLIGQFHDELVLDYNPWAIGAQSLDFNADMLRTFMQKAPGLPSFLLDADVHSDYRYIK